MRGRHCGSVLIADDDPPFRSLLQWTLEQAGFTVRTAETGPEALAAASDERPGIVVLDVHLPGLSGYEVCRELRERFGDGLPILFVSGTKTEPLDRVAGLLIGADDYLTKPFELDELLARVRGLLRRSAASGPDQASALTPRELAVLRLLAEGFDQSEIAEQLGISARTVGRHIEGILDKLGVHSRAQAVALAYREQLVQI